MALFPMNIGSGGGTMSETELWSNSSPTSNFAGQIVTISSDMNSFKYLKFVFKYSKSDNTEMSAIYTVDDFKTFAIGVGYACGAVVYRPGGTNMVRRIAYSSDTSINISGTKAMDISGSDDSLLIPLAIYGMN